jgi:hypothetical protein
MDHSENDILISAYLDDELTVDERAHVERLLANSAEARQLLDEMRALRTGLQELPQHKLELDFAHRVLQRAEEIGERPSEGGQASKELDSPSLPTTDPSTLPAVHDARQDHIPRPFGRRGIAWSLIAIAAAVLISVTTRSSNENRQAAPGGPPAMVRSPAAPDQSNIEKRELAADRLTNVPLEIRAAEKEIATPAEESVAKTQSNASQGNSLQSEGTVAESDSRVAESRQKTDRFDQPASNSLAVQDRDAQNATLGSSSSMMPAPGIGGKLSVQDRVAVDRARGSELATGAPVATTSHAVAAVPQAIVDRFSPEIVVCADMPADAAQRGAFDQVLAKNSISLPVAQQNTPFNFKRSTTDTLRRGSATSGQNGVGNDVDVVYVEAAPEQIQNTLTDLRHSPQIFSAVAVTDVQAPAESKDKMGLQENKSAATVLNDTAGARSGGGQEPQLPTAKPALSQQSSANLPPLGRAQRIDLLDEAIQPPASDAKTAGRNDDGVVGQIVAGENPAAQSAGLNYRAEAQNVLNGNNSQKQLGQQQRAVFLLRIVQPTDRAASEPPFPAAAPAMQPSAPQAPAAEPAKK